MESNMSSEQSSMNGGGEQLSALVDGELAGEGLQRACAAWRSDPSVRQRWHAYHLIGDVLRSDDLASTPARDEAFLQRLRGRLADEPVVLAPQTATPMTLAAGRAARRWRAGAAVAAGFVVVAGVLVATQVPSPERAPSLASRAPDAVSPVATMGTVTPVALGADPSPEQAVLVTDGKVIRDARLDRYLAAHQRFVGASALGAPSVFLRSATTDGAQR
jgi:sigma-E factor negative regulatory protein RseA